MLTVGILGTTINDFRDSQGYFTSPTETFTTESYALTSPTVGEITITPEIQKLPIDVATIRLTATSTGSDLFIGIAPKADMDEYLDGVERTEISSIQHFPFKVTYREIPGSRAPAPPADQHFWAESAAGPGTQQVRWRVEPGEWGVVVMNADASPGVTVDLQTAARSDLVLPIATLLIVIGAILLLGGVAMLIVGAVILGRRHAPAQAAGPAPTPSWPAPPMADPRSSPPASGPPHEPVPPHHRR